MNKKIIVAVVVIIAVIGLYFFVARGNSTTNTSGDISSTNGTIIISPAELSQHTSLENCWVAYKGKVYDVTGWLPKHPGTAGAILPYCGTAQEFEDAFTKQHGTTKAGLLMKVAVLMGDFKVRGSSG